MRRDNDVRRRTGIDHAARTGDDPAAALAGKATDPAARRRSVEAGVVGVILLAGVPHRGRGIVRLATPAFLLMRTGTAGTVIAGLTLPVLLPVLLGTYAVWIAETFPTPTARVVCLLVCNVSAALFAGTVPFVMTVLIEATGSSPVPRPTSWWLRRSALRPHQESDRGHVTAHAGGPGLAGRH